MCGIVGVASFQDINKRNWINKAINTLSHRGLSKSYFPGTPIVIFIPEIII